MSQINFKSKYLKYKTKYLFIKNNQIGSEHRSSLNILNGGAADSVQEEQIKKLEKQLQELETKYNNDLLQLNTNKENYINDLNEKNFFATDNPLDIPTSETYNSHYNYNYEQDKQKILKKIQLLKSPISLQVPPTVIQSVVLPVTQSVQQLTVSSQSKVQYPLNTHYFETRNAESK